MTTRGAKFEPAYQEQRTERASEVARHLRGERFTDDSSHPGYAHHQSVTEHVAPLPVGAGDGLSAVRGGLQIHRRETDRNAPDRTRMYRWVPRGTGRYAIVQEQTSVY